MLVVVQPPQVITVAEGGLRVRHKRYELQAENGKTPAFLRSHVGREREREREREGEGGLFARLLVTTTLCIFGKLAFPKWTPPPAFFCPVSQGAVRAKQPWIRSISMVLNFVLLGWLGAFHSPLPPNSEGRLTVNMFYNMLFA